MYLPNLSIRMWYKVNFNRAIAGFNSEFSIEIWDLKKTKKTLPGLSFTYRFFGLVSLFNGISTLCRLFNAKAILREEQ